MPKPKYHAHFEQTHKRIKHRLSIIQGQVQGIERMIASGAYCPDILRQSRAVQRSLQSLDRLLLENHIHQHVVGMLKSGKEEQATKELLDFYRHVEES